MTTHFAKSFTGAFLIAALSALPAFASADNQNNGQYGSDGYSSSARNTFYIAIPKEDRFAPFAKEIHVGDTVVWVNYDEDEHTVSSVDKFTTVTNRHIRYVIPGVQHKNDKPHTFRLTFNRPGTFVYHCEFHSVLDKYSQPIAPGPEGGIQDKNGNYGTPMMGVITVLPAKSKY